MWTFTDVSDPTGLSDPLSQQHSVCVQITIILLNNGLKVKAQE
jgi:hypothetical protein